MPASPFPNFGKTAEEAIADGEPVSSMSKGHMPPVSEEELAATRLAIAKQNAELRESSPPVNPDLPLPPRD